MCPPGEHTNLWGSLNGGDELLIAVVVDSWVIISLFPKLGRFIEVVSLRDPHTMN
jgi:hypothetical protein